MKNFNIGFPKEGQEYGWRDIWKWWGISFMVLDKWHLNTFLEFMTPLGTLQFLFCEGQKYRHADEIESYTGWYWFHIEYCFPIGIVEFKLKIPLGKWRKKAWQTRIAYVEGARIR